MGLSVCLVLVNFEFIIAEQGDAGYGSFYSTESEFPVTVQLSASLLQFLMSLTINIRILKES